MASDNTEDKKVKEVRASTPSPPSGKERFKWYGPGLIWMLSSVGSGSVLFTPRVGSRYEYSLLWIALIVFVLMWVMIKEVGRYTVVTGKTILDGYRDISGKSGWALWLIFVPQIVAAVVTIAGIAALAGSALMIAFPGNQLTYAIGLIVLSIILVVSGRYVWVERATNALAAILVVIVVVTATRVISSGQALLKGAVPNIPSDFDIDFVLPWVGFILAGAAGIMWFSYWVVARQYGGPQANPSDVDHIDADADENEERSNKLRQWVKIMSTTAAIGVLGGGLIIVAFTILGAELLAPEGIVPEGIQVAKDLTRLLSEVWGEAGYWMLITAIVIALGGTVLANQDGWGRMFADATIVLLAPWFEKNDKVEFKNRNEIHTKEDLPRRQHLFYSSITQRRKLKNIYAVLFCAVIPILLLFIVQDPVDILSIGGAVAAAHTPIVVFLTMYLNYKKLPKQLSPGIFATVVMTLSGLFYLGFALFYFIQGGTG
ncbi:divalent metal cation transporter [Pontibacter diazotrophicus]|uniref:Divalent metal cation transporter n=1 Tax=Pontibacter diazotrophicus TaxID=1400979 RepID=A0A3D8L6F8_9BACT|nr:Nramp family divalent metal transporter [Pontibacter diazotrophicus]RDV12994.1 divalent metal cation transporter [Pontibacter diazotrophicus]